MKLAALSLVLTMTVAGLPVAAAQTSSTGAVTPGHIVKKVPPVYPSKAKQQRVSGTVALRLIIGEKGNVEQIISVTGPDLLRPAAVDAVRQWKYTPYLLDGKPTKVDTTITVNFALNGVPQPPSDQPATQPIYDDDIPDLNANPLAPSTEPQEQPVRVSGGVVAANILTKVMPVFPEEARCKHIGGGVIVHVLIGKDGRVISADPVSGPEVLRKPYAAAVKQSTYKPFVLNGQPVEVETTVSVNPQVNATGCAPDPPQP